MVSGRDPGQLGLYGFRNRDSGYDLRLATSGDIRTKRVWDRLGEHGYRSAILFVPPTSPPSALRGKMVSCFLTPNVQANYTYPRSYKAELEASFGPYRMDIEGFRSGDLERILDDLHTMTHQHFSIARKIWTDDHPDFLMMVEMGPDRLHHALWHHIDPTHPAYEKENRWEREALEYYRALDAEIGKLLQLIDERTYVLIASDHGAQTMRGAIAINEWLQREGWLVLRTSPSAPTPIRNAIDWTRTRAWGEGGYYARIFLNVRGREPSGIVELDDIENVIRELSDALHNANLPNARAYRPQELYAEVRGKAPDLMVAFEDFAYRSVGTVGHTDYRLSTDGNDGCNHAWDG